MNKLTFGFVVFLSSSASAVAYGQCPSGAIDEEAARDRVQAALHSDPYFYDQHVTVSIEKDNIVLRGFVFSDWDLRDAMRISSRAACNWRVLDNLQIMTGGRR